MWSQVLEAWSKGDDLPSHANERDGTMPARKVSFELVDTPRRKRFLRARHLHNGSVLREGVPLGVHERPTENHVYWIRTDENDIIGCYEPADGSERKELTLHMCQQIWPNIHTADLDPNEQMLPTGVRIPIVPHKFVEYKRHHAETARRGRSRNRRTKSKRARRAVPRVPTATPPPHSAPAPEAVSSLTALHPTPVFDLRSAPTLAELRVSVRRARPLVFLTLVQPTLANRPPENKPKNLTRDVVVFQSDAWELLNQARNQIAAHPSFHTLFDANPFESLHSIDDLPKLTIEYKSLQIPISKEMLRWFHYFFPQADSNPP